MNFRRKCLLLLNYSIFACFWNEILNWNSMFDVYFGSGSLNIRYLWQVQREKQERNIAKTQKALWFHSKREVLNCTTLIFSILISHIMSEHSYNFNIYLNIPLGRILNHFLINSQRKSIRIGSDFVQDKMERNSIIWKVLIFKLQIPRNNQVVRYQWYLITVFNMYHQSNCYSKTGFYRYTMSNEQCWAKKKPLTSISNSQFD